MNITGGTFNNIAGFNDDVFSASETDIDYLQSSAALIVYGEEFCIYNKSYDAVEIINGLTGGSAIVRDLTVTKDLDVKSGVDIGFFNDMSVERMLLLQSVVRQH